MNLDVELRKILESCEAVERITEKQIVFSYRFRVAALERYFAGVSPDTIFKDAGIPIEQLKPEYARNRMKKWIKQFKEQGVNSLKGDRRGTIKSANRGRPKKKKSKLTYEELEVLVEIQTEIIESLKKKRTLARQKS